MRFDNLVVFAFFLISLLSIPVMSQSEQGYLLGIKNFEKSFPSENIDWDSYENLYLDAHYDKNLKPLRLGLKSQEIIGKRMTYEYGIYNVDLVITSDSTLYLKDNKTGKDANQKTTTIHIDENTMLVSWLEDDNTFITMLSDFHNGKASAFLYKENGNVTPIRGSIKMK
jgi:hypothetical protein